MGERMEVQEAGKEGGTRGGWRYEAAGEEDGGGGGEEDGGMRRRPLTEY